MGDGFAIAERPTRQAWNGRWATAAQERRADAPAVLAV